VVVFEGKDKPADGARVRVEVVEASKVTDGHTVGEELARLAGAAQGLPPDLALRHDEYRRTKGP
jgi:hypothetical protein